MKRLARQGLPLIAAVLASACSTPREQPRVVQLAPAALGLGQATSTVAADWWRVFGDPQLDRLVATGLADSPSLAEALARVRAAEARVDTERAGLRPRITGSVQLMRARIGDKLLAAPIGGSAANLGIAVGNLSWNLDPFGRRHAIVRQAAAASDAERLDAADARLTVATAIAQTYVGLARADQLIVVTNSFVTTRQRAIALVQSRIRNQLASQFDLRAAQTLLAEAQQARTQALAERDVLVHALAALVGRGADFYAQITPPTLALDRPPPLPRELPADLLGRRPDLLAGRARIDESVQGRKAAAAAFLPDVSITALAGLTSIGLGDLFTGGAFTYSAGPAISLPIFEGGRLRALYRSATADLDAAVASYNGSVLAAVRDAADALGNVRASDQALADETRVVAGLRGTVALDAVRVRTGLGSSLDAIDPGFRLLEAEQALVGLQADTLARRIELVAALGGGFDPARPLPSDLPPGDHTPANPTDPRS